VAAANSAAQVSTDLKLRASPASGSSPAASALSSATNHGSISVRRSISSVLTSRRTASNSSSKRSCEGTSRRPSSSSVSSGMRTRTSVSRERIAFMNACLKVRPIAIASPTDCMWVESRPLVPGNFSKAKRGHLTTT
jgi:hypothetical protein